MNSTPDSGRTTSKVNGGESSPDEVEQAVVQQRLAGTSERTMAEWMRGATSPMAMNGLLNLLSALKADDAVQVLALWREAAPQNPTGVQKAQEIQN